MTHLQKILGITWKDRVADDEVVQQRRGGPHLKRTWWTEESIGTASGLWLQTGLDWAVFYVPSNTV